MKTLATCKPTEFLRQTSRVRRAVDKWLSDTDILNIRKNLPQLEKIDPGLPEEERVRIFKANQEKTRQQMRENLGRMLDAILEDNPDETLEVLALLCFVEPQDIDNHTVTEYIEAITEMIGNEAVIGFFTSLARWGLTATSDASKA